jgi:MATE family multidrug resistance protein
VWKEIRQTLILGWPIILGNLSQMALGVIDSAMVGAIHSSQLAASSFVNNIIALPFILSMGMTNAISPLVAAAEGEGDRDKPLRICFNGMAIVGIFSILSAILLHWGSDIVFYMGQDEIVAELSGDYLIWSVWAIVPMALFMAMKQFSEGLGYSSLPMWVGLASIPLNVLVNYAFIYGYWGAPRMELEGAGVGTLIARLLIVIAMGVIILKGRKYAPYRQHLSQQLQVRRDRLQDVIRIGLPASLQHGMEAAAFAFSGLMAGWLGYVQQAAHQIALNIAAITFMVSMGISAAGGIRAAYAFGQKNWKQVRQIGTTTMGMAMAYGLFCALLFMLGRYQLPLFFNDEAPVLAWAASLLHGFNRRRQLKGVTGHNHTRGF